MEWEKGPTTEIKNGEIRDMENWCMKGSSTQHAEGPPGFSKLLELLLYVQE